jgi:hypothetical protein
MDRAVSNAKMKEHRSNSGTANRLLISSNPTSQTMIKPTTIILKKSSKKFEMTLFIFLSASDNTNAF